MSEDAGLPPGYPPPATLLRVAVVLLLGAATFLVAILLAYTSEAGRLHGASWLGFVLGGLIFGVLAGFVVLQVRLRRQRRRRSAGGAWLAVIGVAGVFAAGALSPAANATYGAALLVAGFAICLALGVAALRLARRPADPD